MTRWEKKKVTAVPSGQRISERRLVYRVAEERSNFYIWVRESLLPLVDEDGLLRSRVPNEYLEGRERHTVMLMTQQSGLLRRISDLFVPCRNHKLAEDASQQNPEAGERRRCVAE